MRMVCITDLHGAPQALDRILSDAGPADVVLLGGDITSFGTPNAAEFLVRRAMEHCPQVLAVAGNCDSAAIDERLASLGVSLFGRGVMLQGVGFYGVSAMPPWTGTMYELSEDEIAASLGAGRGQLTRWFGLKVRLSGRTRVNQTSGFPLPPARSHGFHIRSCSAA